MSAPPSVRQIAREALGEAPSWMDKLLGPLNIFMRQTVDALSSNLTPSENLAQRWMDLTVAEGATIQPFATGIGPRAAKGVSVERVTPLGTGSTPGTIPTGAVTILWTPTTVGGAPGISISQVFGLATGARYTLTLLVKAE